MIYAESKVHQSGCRAFEWAWLIKLLCLISTSTASRAPGQGIILVLNINVLVLAFSTLQFTDLYQTSYVSKRFVNERIKSLCYVQRDGRISLDYTKMLYKPETLVQDARKGVGMVKANTVSRAFPILCASNPFYRPSSSWTCLPLLNSEIRWSDHIPAGRLHCLFCSSSTVESVLFPRTAPW